ncbi:nitrogen assimilation transcriptional regulator NAC [Burkholderia gladioli pv. gladioli]|uniref:nitrogen assimilation transcriptional regulator NAC n=1 Tax=Burkholderia gladioli TaxID=28095 RepID=UPI001D1036A8|nr:nitrogen assimilation transcriptional regulator NAC [Burkholderia gladioli]MDJ1164159.1 nitrogen assimilation transcriptional regulator NAC [Burkholderia gladioli pv. gladioli]
MPYDSRHRLSNDAQIAGRTTVNLRRLKYFVKIVDLGSLTQASDILHIAQPALSQQIMILEGEFRHQLLIRTKRGVTPTEAGLTLYRHAQIVLRQLEQARSDMDKRDDSLVGKVAIGLAPGTAASALSLPLLKTVRAQHPGILLYLNESFGTTLSELIINGRMDMAVLYGDHASHGLSFRRLKGEELFLVTPRDMTMPVGPIPLSMLQDVDLMLPSPYNYLRKYIDDALNIARVRPRIVAEIESASPLSAAIREGIGATILPESAARIIANAGDGVQRRIVAPRIEAPLSICVSDHLPLSEPAVAVQQILLDLISNLSLDGGTCASSDEVRCHRKATEQNS